MTDAELIVAILVLCIATLYALGVRFRKAVAHAAAVDREWRLGNIDGVLAIMEGRWDGKERRASPRLRRSFRVRIGELT